MKNKTIKDIIFELQDMGLDVHYRKRTDGGYLITSIEGEKFTGAQGNARARAMTGEFISQKRQTQLAKIKPPKLEKLDIETQKLIKQTQRVWKKNKKPKDGRITTKRFRKKLAKVGLEEAQRGLKEIQRYAKGIAYSENIKWLIDRLSNGAYKGVYDTIIEYIKEHSDTFKEDWIQEINQIMYDVDNNIISIPDSVTAIRKIIGFKKKEYIKPTIEIVYAS